MKPFFPLLFIFQSWLERRLPKLKPSGTAEAVAALLMSAGGEFALQAPNQSQAIIPCGPSPVLNLLVCVLVVLTLGCVAGMTQQRVTAEVRTRAAFQGFLSRF